MQFCLAAVFASVLMFSNTPVHADDHPGVGEAIEILAASYQSRLDGSFIGILSQAAVNIGFTLAGWGAITNYAIPELTQGKILGRLSNGAIRLGSRVFVVGAIGTGVAILYSFLPPSRRFDSIMGADNYESNAGLRRYFQLPRERQIELANFDPDLAAYLTETAAALVMLQGK